MINRTLAFLAAALVTLDVVAAGDSFTLTNLRDQRTYGPFTRQNGAKVSIAGADYSLKAAGQDRVSFVSKASGIEYGPIQIVNGRLGVIGHATYRVSMDTATAPAKGAQGARQDVPAPTAAASTAFVQPPPAMPDKIDIPEPQPRRTVAPLDLPLLPEAKDVFLISAWLAPIDNAPIDWKLASKSAGDGAIERVSVGAGIDWRGWSARVTASPSVKCDDICSDGPGLADVSIDGGMGWSLGIGYMHPFLVEGGWSVNAGIRGLLRRDSGDLKSSTLVSSGEADTNAVGNVISRYENHTTSVDVTELSLWVDIELAYAMDFWGVQAGVSIAPVDEFDISASVPYGNRSVSLKAERSTPISVSAGGWYEYEGWRIFADLTVGADRALRLGVGHGF